MRWKVVLNWYSPGLGQRGSFPRCFLSSLLYAALSRPTRLLSSLQNSRVHGLLREKLQFFSPFLTGGTCTHCFSVSFRPKSKWCLGEFFPLLKGKFTRIRRGSLGKGIYIFFVYHIWYIYVLLIALSLNEFSISLILFSHMFLNDFVFLFFSFFFVSTLRYLSADRKTFHW